MNKKKLFIILALIAVMIALVFALKNKLFVQKFNYKIEQITNYNYFILKENNKYGVIDSSGNIIVDAKYQNIIIPNPEKDIFVCYTESSPIILNSNSEELFKEYESVEPIKLKNVANPLAYEKSVLKYKKNNLYGLINFNGKTITKNLYDSIENLQPTEGKLLIKKDNKVGVIDIKGNTIITPDYDNIISDEYYTENDLYKKSGFIVSNKTDVGFKYGYIDYKGKKLLNIKYSAIDRVSLDNNKNIYLIASDNGKYGVYKNSKKVIKNDYTSISYDENLKIFFIEKNKKYGVASLDGKIIISIENDTIESRGIYIYTKIGNESKVYDSKGNVVDVNYNRSIYATQNDNYRISTTLNNNVTYYGIVNKEGHQLVEEKYRYIEYLYENYFIAKDESGSLGVINNNGKTLLDIKYDSVQKIKGKNIVQAIISNNTTEIYSKDLQKVCIVQNANINNQENYVLIYNDMEKIYLDENGNEIKDESKIKNLDFPENLGSYKKIQSTLEVVYYEKE